MLLQNYWIPTDQLFCSIQVPDLASQFAGHSQPPIATFYNEIVYPMPEEHPNRIGVVISRPLTFYSKQTDPISIYYMDYLCIRRENATVENTRTLFQTHEYNMRILNPEINVSLFKKEVELIDGVVPLVEYRSYTFYLRNLKLRSLPTDFQIARVQRENVGLLHDFLGQVAKTVFDVAMLADVGSLLTLLKDNQMFMYVLKRGDQVFAMYWFKNAHVKSDAEALGDTLHFVASYRNTENVDLFSLGFSHSLRMLLRERRDFRMLMMDDLAHNRGIVELWTTTHDVIVETKCAYYLYNYVYGEKVERDRYFMLV